MNEYVSSLFEELANLDFEIEHIEGQHLDFVTEDEIACHEARDLVLSDIRLYYELG